MQSNCVCFGGIIVSRTKKMGNLTEQTKENVPNDHGHFGENTADGKHPSGNKLPTEKKTAETEGLNEEKSTGDAGAYEGFENAGE